MARTSSAVFVVYLVLACGLGLASCRTDIQSGIDSANDLLYQKQYVEAERLYRKLLKRLPPEREMDEREAEQRLTILDRLGKINALYLNDYPQAIADYGHLVRLYPKTAQACAARATVADIYQHKLGDVDAAIDEYQKLVNEFPNRNETRWAQLQIVHGYFQQKNYDQARTEAEALINRWPKSKEASQARFQIANAYYVQGRYTEAIATYERLLEGKTDPSLAALVLFELGNCFQELSSPERALHYFYASLPDHPNPLLVQGKIRRVRRRMHSSKPISGIYQSLYATHPANHAGESEGGNAVIRNGPVDHVAQPVSPNGVRLRKRVDAGGGDATGEGSAPASSPSPKKPAKPSQGGDSQPAPAEQPAEQPAKKPAAASPPAKKAAPVAAKKPAPANKPPAKAKPPADGP